MLPKEGGKKEKKERKRKKKLTKRQHLLNRVIIRNKHSHPINSHSESAGRGKSVFKTLTKVLINHLGLVVALILLIRLFGETETLVKGVVEFGVGIDDFLLAHEGFEALADSGEGAVVFGEWGHHLWVACDEGGVDAGLFDEFADHLLCGIVSLAAGRGGGDVLCRGDERLFAAANNRYCVSSRPP